MKARRLISLLAMLLVAIMLLSACAPIPGKIDNTTNGQDEEVTTTNPKSEGEKILRLSRSWEDSSWDPATFTGNDQLALAPFIFETLCLLNSDGSSSALLAESWEKSGDGLSYIFHLRHGVQWHNGYGEMTSEDIKFTFERNADETSGSIQMENLKTDNIVSIETPDAYTVVFKLAAPDVDFVTRCSMYPSYIYSKAAFDDMGAERFALEPIGTGAYQYDKGTSGSQTEAVKFDSYWGGAPTFDRITNSMITDTNTNYSAFDNGELDAIYVYYMDKVNEYKEKGCNITYIPSHQLLYLGLNMQIAPFNNELVREAFFAAINPQYYIEEIFYDGETIPTGCIPPTCKYALTDYFKPTYNTEKSKALLAEAGYPNGVDMTLWTVNDEISTAPALISQNQLSEAGFNVELQLVDFSVFIDKVRNGEAPCWLLYNSTSVIADDTITRYTSDRYPGSNWCGVTDSTYDDLVSKGFNASTETDKDNYYKEAQKRFIDMNVIYPVSTYGYYLVSQPYINGMSLNGANTIDIMKVTTSK